MLRPMPEVRSRHWACGTEVRERIPEGYDLSEGLILVCPRCREAWWHYPDRPGVGPAGERAAAAVGEPGAPFSEPGRHLGDRPDAGGQADRQPQRRWTSVAGWTALTLALLAAGAAAIGLFDRPAPPPRPSSPTTLPAQAAPAGSRRLRAAGFTIQAPAGWWGRRQGPGVVLLPRARADVSLRARSLPRGGLSLRRLGTLAVGLLRSELPGARVGTPRPARLDGRAALRVNARRGALVRELTVTAAGARAYVLDLRRVTTADRRGVALARAAVRSFRTAPGA